MSASRERKKRMELAASGQSPKQIKAAEAKKKKNKNILTGIIVAVLVLAIVLGSVYGLLIRPSIMPRNTAALRVGDHELSAVEFSYYYYDVINSFYQTYGSYMSLMMSDPTLPLDEQIYDESTGQTWADYFMESAAEIAKYDYAAYDAALADGYTLSAEGEQSIDEAIATLEESAKAAGFASLKQYFAQVYGQGSSESSYYDYQLIRTTAAEYAQKIDAERTYTDEEIAALEAENPALYSNVTYRSFYLSSSNYKTTDETEETTDTETSTEAEDAAALAAAEADANKMAEESQGDEDKFIEMAYNLASETLKESYEDPNATMNTNQPYENVNSYLRDWLFDESRQAGDTTVISDESTGFYVVYFYSQEENNYNTINVRHILVSPEVDVDADGDGVTETSSEEALNAAEAEAAQILSDWESGEATEESFAALADEKSEDTAEGGLYENVYRGMMVDAFNDWCFDESRQSGDTEIVYSEYGYHVMYFVGEGDVYRTSMIIEDLKEEDYAAWSEELIAGYDTTLMDKGTAYLRTDLVLGTSDTDTSSLIS